MNKIAPKNKGPNVCCKCCKRRRFRVVDGKYVEVSHDCPVERPTEKGTGNAND